MSATVTPPAPAVVGFVPRPLRWTVDEFHRVNATGIWEGRRPILIDGVILEQGPMNPPHATLLTLATRALERAFAPGHYVRVRQPLKLGLETDPQPDLAVVAGDPTDHMTVHPRTALLVVEVSDSTLALDLTTKAELYATAGLSEYWVVDVGSRTLIVLRDPRPLPASLGAVAYRTRLTFTRADSVAPLAAPAASVRVADLIP